MTAQDLKNSILQLAVQGKLVPQDPNDEPASELLKRIKAEKQKLIKEGKIKKDKFSSEIYLDADNIPYEKRGTETRCIADELPFDIPDSWAWVRLGEIFDLSYGKLLPVTKLTPTGYDVFGANGVIGKYNKYLYKKRQLLISCRGAYSGTPNISPEYCYITNNSIVCTSFSDELYSKEFFYYLFSSSDIRIPVTGTAQPQVTSANAVLTIIPLPPLAEQKRIVAKIEELLPYLEEYGKREVELSALNKNFPDALKKSILQCAVQGKLVPQDNSDEPAEKLLEKIRAEKQKLIKEGKIKKSKTESQIFRRGSAYYEKCGTEENCIDSELPFDIPDSWAWVRLGNITYNFGQKKPDKNFSYIDVGSIDNIFGKLSETETILSPENAPSRARKIVEKGCVLYSTVRPYLLNIVIIDKEFKEETIASTAFAVLNPYSVIYNKYLYYSLRSQCFIDYVNSVMIGVAYPAINDEKLYNALLPLPPLAEQKRIVAKIEELFTVVEAIKK